jgi:hypothetical protein
VGKYFAPLIRFPLRLNRRPARSQRLQNEARWPSRPWLTCRWRGPGKYSTPPAYASAEDTARAGLGYAARARPGIARGCRPGRRGVPSEIAAVQDVSLRATLSPAVSRIPSSDQSADRRAKIRGDLAYRSLTGVISTCATPLFVRPIFCAAAGDRSRLRPRTAGPRSLILTWVERPFFRLVTLKLDPSGSVFEAAVRALGSKRSPLEVRCPA